MSRTIRTKILALALLSVFALPAFGSVEPTATSPLGFKDWKASRINEAKSALEKLQVELDPNLSKAQSSKAANLPKSQKADTRLSQAKTNLAIAQELGAHDYFVLYLSQLKTEAEVQEAAKKLDPSEVAEIMIGIKKQLSEEGTNIVAPPIVTPTPGMRTSRNP